MNLNGTIKKTQALSGRLVKSSGGGGSVQEIYWVQFGVGTATNAEVNEAVAANKLPICYWDSTDAYGRPRRTLYFLIRNTPTESFFSGVDYINNTIIVRRLYADAWDTQTIRYEGKLTWDTTPRFGSQNPVTSGGIYQALQNVTIPVDSELSSTSESPVQNKVITAALATKADQASVESTIPPIVNTWLSENVAQETGYVLDSSLTMSNAAAPADKVGELRSAIENLEAIPHSVKMAMDTLFSKAAYADADAASSYATFHAWATANPVTSITAVFTQGSAVIYDTDSLDTLKQYLTVTATYSDSTTATVTDYTLSGTLAAGTSTITVSYGGKTDTFNVTVIGWAVEWSYLDGGLPAAVDSASWTNGYVSGNEVSFVANKGAVYTYTSASGTSAYQVRPTAYETSNKSVWEIVTAFEVMPAQNGVVLRMGNGTNGLQVTIGNSGISMDNGATYLSGVTITTNREYTIKAICDTTGTCKVYLDDALVYSGSPTSAYGTNKNMCMMTSGRGTYYIKEMRFAVN